MFCWRIPCSGFVSGWQSSCTDSPVLLRQPGLSMLLPFFQLFALISAIVNGLAADFLLALLSKDQAFQGLQGKQALHSENRRPV
jgi:hypothetical protein